MVEVTDDLTGNKIEDRIKKKSQNGATKFKITS